MKEREASWHSTPALEQDGEEKQLPVLNVTPGSRNVTENCLALVVFSVGFLNYVNGRKKRRVMQCHQKE